MLITNKKINKNYAYIIHTNTATIAFDLSYNNIDNKTNTRFNNTQKKIDDNKLVEYNFITKPIKNIKDDVIVYITEPVFYQIFYNNDNYNNNVNDSNKYNYNINGDNNNVNINESSKAIRINNNIKIKNIDNYRIIRYNQNLNINNINIKCISSNTCVGWCNYIINYNIYYITSLSTLNRLTLFYDYKNNIENTANIKNNNTSTDNNTTDIKNNNKNNNISTDTTDNYYIINYKANNCNKREILDNFIKNIIESKEYKIILLEDDIFFYELFIHLYYILYNRNKNNDGDIQNKEDNRELIIISDNYYTITNNILSAAEYFRIKINYNAIKDIKVYRSIEDINKSIIFINKYKYYREYNMINKYNNNIIESVVLECNIDDIKKMFKNVIYPYENDSDIFIESNIYNHRVLHNYININDNNRLDDSILDDSNKDYDSKDNDKNINNNVLIGNKDYAIDTDLYLINSNSYIKRLFEKEYYIFNGKYYFIEENIEVEIKNDKFIINKL